MLLHVPGFSESCTTSGLMWDLNQSMSSNTSLMMSTAKLFSWFGGNVYIKDYRKKKDIGCEAYIKVHSIVQKRQ